MLTGLGEAELSAPAEPILTAPSLIWSPPVKVLLPARVRARLPNLVSPATPSTVEVTVASALLTKKTPSTGAPRLSKRSVPPRIAPLESGEETLDFPPRMTPPLRRV